MISITCFFICIRFFFMLFIIVFSSFLPFFFLYEQVQHIFLLDFSVYICYSFFFPTISPSSPYFNSTHSYLVLLTHPRRDVSLLPYFHSTLHPRMTLYSPRPLLHARLRLRLVHFPVFAHFPHPIEFR